MQDDVGQSGPDDVGHQAGGHVQIRGFENAGDLSPLEQRARLVDARFADGLVKAANLGDTARVRGGGLESREARVPRSTAK